MCSISFKFIKKLSIPETNNIEIVHCTALASGLIMHKFYSFLLPGRCQHVSYQLLLFFVACIASVPLCVYMSSYFVFMLVHHKNHYLINLFASHLLHFWDYFYFWTQPDQITYIHDWMEPLFFMWSWVICFFVAKAGKRSGIAPNW